MSQNETRTPLLADDDDNFDYVNADLAIRAERFTWDKLEPLGNLGFWVHVLVTDYNRAAALRCKTRKELEALLTNCKSDVTGHWLAVRQLCWDIGLTRNPNLTLKEYIQIYLDFRFPAKQVSAS